ncbi:MAG: hypothetical protein ACQETI_03635 [Halobacteriota archaeon]
MNNDSRHFTRRQLLAGIGTVGLVTTGAGFTRELRSRPFSRFAYTLAQTDEDDGRLLVSWYETYNGDYQESQPNTTAENWNGTDTTQYVPGVPATPVISLSNVLPGDTGALVVGFLAEGDEDLNVWVKPQLLESDERSVNEPELKAGDLPDDPTDPFDGELAAATDALLWHDIGLVDNGVVGACDGSFTEITVGENTLVSEPVIASGTFEDLRVADGYGGLERDGWILLDFTHDDDATECLTVGRQQCVGFEWRVPKAEANLLQSDSAVFSLAVAATPCSYRDESDVPLPPFDEGGEPA